MKIYTKLLLAVVMLFTLSIVNADDTGLEGKEISTYLVGNYVDVQTATSKLESIGYEIVATYSPVEQGHTVIFTNEALKAEGSKSKRAYGAILRLFVDDKEKTISFTNPVYFGKAFMQDDYNHSVYNAQIEAIKGAFNGLKGSKDKLAFNDLSDYHFMFGMPYYADVDELSEASNGKLLSKARSYEGGKLLIFELKLSDTSTLIGYELNEETKKFVSKIGRANAAVLPYCISIEDGVASSLAGKYYLAVSYPKLSMGEFMTISDIPSAISQNLAKVFK